MGKHKAYDISIIKELWETTDLTINEIANKTKISSDMIRYYIKKSNFIRPDDLKQREIERTKNRRKQTRINNNNGKYFSDESINKSKKTRLSKNNGKYFSDDTNNKRLNTNIIKYGVANVFQNDKVKQKAKQTKLDRYNDEFYNNKEQAVVTRLDKYNSYMTDDMLRKSKNTSIKKFGTEYYMQTNEYKNRARQTRLSKNNGKYFSDKTIIKLQEIGKQNYKLSGVKRINTINERYETFRNCYYTENIKMLKILQDPAIELEKYIKSLDEHNRNFAYIEDDLQISYTTLLLLLKQFNLKGLLNNTRSHFQQEIINYITTLGVRYIENDRTQIKPLELDIFIPDGNIAIECNGNFWHSSQNNVNKDYHYNKSKLCEENGIRLIHIFEYEWNNDRQRPILKNIINNALHNNSNKIYARKCNIVIKKSNEMKEFFNNNNIQGFRGGKFAICLEYNNEIIMSYMMGKAFFGKGKYEWEVIRGATKLGYTVVGGASKIWNYFIKTYDPKNCVYYIDYNYFNGNSMLNLPKMQFIKTQPSFKNYWVKEGIVKNREPQKHKEIQSLYKSGEVLQIYNAGTKVYVWKNNNSL